MSVWHMSALPTNLCNGGANGIRTRGLFHAMEARYQLRHSPSAVIYLTLVVPHMSTWRIHWMQGGRMPCHDRRIPLS